MDKPLTNNRKPKTKKKIVFYSNPIPATRTSQNMAQCNLKNTTPLEERITKNGWCTFG